MANKCRESLGRHLTDKGKRHRSFLPSFVGDKSQDPPTKGYRGTEHHKHQSFQ